MKPELHLLAQEFCVCKVRELTPDLFDTAYCFMARTPDENSLVCPSSLAPRNCIAREGGWRCLRVKGPLDFSLTGVLAGIAGPLSTAGIAIFSVSTYDTDYILVKSESLTAAIQALERADYQVVRCR